MVVVGLLAASCGADEAAPPASNLLPLGGAPPGYSRGGQAYDTARQRLVYFGGYHPTGEVPLDVVAYGSTWEWDGVSWTNVADSGPSPRYDVAMAYDPERAVVVLHGGFGGCGAGGFVCCDDTWTWNGVAWRRIDATGPGLLRSAHLNYDPNSKSLLLFGGERCGEGSPNRTLWRFDGHAWSEVAP